MDLMRCHSQMGICVKKHLLHDCIFCRYNGLTIKYVRGADPIIKLLDDDETVIEVQCVFLVFKSISYFFLLTFQTLAIDRWNTDRSVIHYIVKQKVKISYFFSVWKNFLTCISSLKTRQLFRDDQFYKGKL